jgi:hypothetical protein
MKHPAPAFVASILRVVSLSLIGIVPVPIRVPQIRPPIPPIIVPVIPAWVIVPVDRFFDIGSHPDLHGGRARPRRIDITPGRRAEHTQAE